MTRTGSQFYKVRGLKSVTIWITPKAYEALRLRAFKEGRSLTKTTRRMVYVVLRIKE